MRCLPRRLTTAPGGPRKPFLEAVNGTLLAMSDRRISRIFWWKPAGARDRDCFDADGNARPVITVFDKYRRK